MAKTFLTKEGMEKLHADIHYLKTIETRECIEAIADAGSFGDPSENTEYNVAKERYENLNIKISQLNSILTNAVILNESAVNTDNVQILTTVLLKNKTTEKNIKYTIVPHIEVNLKEGRISVNSPVAQALIGKTIGQIVKVNTPAGEIELEILDITLC